MGTKKIKTLNLIVSIIVMVFFLLMLISLLDFFDVINLPQKMSLKYLLASSDTLVVTSDESFEENDVRDKVIVTNQKNNQAYDYESIYDQEYLEELKNPKNTVQVETEVEEIELSSGHTVKRAEEFYYDQLPDEAKEIYIALYNNKEQLRTGLFTVDFGLQFNDILNVDGGEEVVAEAFQLAINALTFDNPEIFYINATKMFLLTEITTYPSGKTEYRITVGANNGESYLSQQFHDKDDVDYAIEELREIRWNIIKQTERFSSIREKIKYVHDYLVNNVSYDQTISKNNIYNIYGALINNEAVCEGYARAFKYILDGMDIPCIIAVGVGTNNSGASEDHAWNYVQIGSKWYAVDVTWDDPIVVGGGEIPDDYKYKFFLSGRDKFFANHEEDGLIIGEVYNFEYPVINLTQY